MEKQDNNTRTIITFAISIVLLILIVAGGTYAFYTNKMETNNIENNSTNVNTNKLEFQIVDGTIKGSNLIPGDTITKTFQIKNTGNIEGTFSLVWKSVVNNFINKQDLIVTLEEDGNNLILENQVLPDTTTSQSIIKDNLKIAPGATKSYTLTIIYQNTEQDQTADMGKSISAVIDMLV